MDKSTKNRLIKLGLIDNNFPEWNYDISFLDKDIIENSKYCDNCIVGNYIEKPKHCSTYFFNREKVYFDGYWREDKVFCPEEVKYSIRHKEGDIYLCERCYQSYINKRMNRGIIGYKYYLHENEDKEYSSVNRYIDVHSRDTDI